VPLLSSVSPSPSTTPVPWNPGNAIAALDAADWTFQSTYGDEFTTVYGSSGGTGLDPAVWSNGWFPSTQWGASEAPHGGDGYVWCDPAQVLVTSSPGANASSSYGAITGFTGASCLQLTVATKTGSGSLASYTTATGFCVSNPGSNLSGGWAGLQITPPFYVETRVWLMPSSSSIPNYPTVWLGSQNDPTTGELDIFEPLGTNGAPVGHSHYSGDPNHPTNALSGAAGVWTVIGVIYSTSAEQCTWYGSVSGGEMLNFSGSVNGTGGTTGPYYWILNNGYPAGGDGNVIPGIMLVDYVRCFTAS
jgi:hypothetical protein